MPEAGAHAMTVRFAHVPARGPTEMILLNGRTCLSALAIAAAATALAGCMGPTYGTGKTQGEQLFDDLDSIIPLGGGDDAKPISYSPRPELVKPKSLSSLPAPEAESADVGVDSPEARRERLKADAARADAGAPVTPELAEAREDMVAKGRVRPLSPRENALEKGGFPLTPQELREGSAEYKKKMAEQQLSPTQRKYLSEPPVAYRQPASTAPVGQQGEDEEVKERRIKNGGDYSLLTKIKDLF